MKQVMAIGYSSSGKSTFSRALHEITGIPLFHLDMLNWNSDKTTVKEEAFQKRLLNAIKQDAWIIWKLRCYNGTENAIL